MRFILEWWSYYRFRKIIRQMIKDGHLYEDENGGLYANPFSSLKR